MQKQCGLTDRLKRRSRHVKTSALPLLPLFWRRTMTHDTQPLTQLSSMETSRATIETTSTAPSVLPVVRQIAAHSFLSFLCMTSVAHTHKVPTHCSAELLTSVSVSLLLSFLTASSYRLSTQSPPLTGFKAHKSEENARKASEETRGCRSWQVLSKVGVIPWRTFANAGGGWVEK